MLVVCHLKRNRKLSFVCNLLRERSRQYLATGSVAYVNSEAMAETANGFKPLGGKNWNLDQFLEKEVELERFFTKQELDKMTFHEQRRLKNIAQNYEIMIYMGLPAIKPDFMKGPAHRAKVAKAAEAAAAQSYNVCLDKSDSDSDEEWTPDMERKKRAKENAVKRTIPHYLKPAKRKLDEKGDRKTKEKRLKKTKKTEEDKIEYSLRERSAASCMNLEPPDDDHFLYCQECKKDFEGDCPVHGPYHYIQDKEVVSGDPLKADNTLPDGLEIKKSKIVGAGLGVFSKMGLESRIMFGPYGGDIITDSQAAHKSGYCWQIYTEGKPSHFVDAQNKCTSNWMRYVNCAMKEADQNLVAFQYKGGIYYCTFKPVLPGEELLVWYGDEYARELGLIRDKNLLFRPKYVNGEEYYPCVYCKIAFTTAIPCVRHLRKVHGGDKLTSCDLQVLDQWLRENDDKYFKKPSQNLNHRANNKMINSILNGKEKGDILLRDSKRNLTSEIAQNKNIKMDGKKYNCELCSYFGNKSDNLKSHMRIHTGERLYKCEVCGHACNRSGNLKKHMSIHTGERLYKCEVCGYACNQSGDLKSHMRIHTGERLYKCEVCGYACNQICNLKTHMRIHTGEKPYKCEVCGYACNHSSRLKNHMKKHANK
ncbi:histone-lysine N-methyltransferase PRDM9-like isoform X6 [Dreissena polymorpha]|uniref:histone-lysine N-methyltransferase PRDM9-like isoform X6 n=1 Tax=Dreissena polymorpha TaxID=45954 RepID=UPI002264990C|nr:histone-lysine N-methyltransferase PRDM9-like isoform X6 [Dreissena polymorpha]